jgi:hypothetical protein
MSVTEYAVALPVLVILGIIASLSIDYFGQFIGWAFPRVEDFFSSISSKRLLRSVRNPSGAYLGGGHRHFFWRRERRVSG